MTVDQFENLSPEQLETSFTSFTTATVSVNVERTLLRPDDDPEEVAAWVTRNADIAQNSNDQGTTRRAGGTLGQRWTWVYLLLHRDGAVTILDAGDTPIPS